MSGLFQVHSPRDWTDSLDESGRPTVNGVPDFLDSWEAFRARTAFGILTNGYAFTTIDALGHEVLYAGVLRASSRAPGSVVVELSQNPGERSLGDLRISAVIDAAGSVGPVQFESWADGSKGVARFVPLAVLAGEGCSEAGTACIVANGALLEVGYNLTALGGPEKEFSGIRIGTPEDQASGAIRIMAAFTAVAGGCVKEVGGVNNPTCTAGDVRLASVKDVVILSGDTCNPNVPNDTITIQSFTGIFTSGPQRYDIGSYVATDGGGADGARSGACTRVAFQNNTAGLATLDTDSCADIAANQTVEIPLGPITIKCVDAFQVGADGNPAAGSDGNIDFFHCETWAQQANEILCRDSRDVKSGTPSKCGCSLTGAAAGFCVPIDDGNACTTEVCQGNCRTATGGGSNATCSSNAECTGAGETCRGITTRSIPVENGTSCGSDPSAENPCDLAPTCQAGSCTPRFAENTTVCRAQNGDCDVADFCTGSSATCSSDAVAPAATACTDDGNVCTNDICNGTLKTCTHPAWPNGPRTGCNATGDQCNDGQQCVGGSCQAAAPKPNGTDCEVGAPGGLCDDQDECEGGTCVEKYKASNTSCREAEGVCDVAESCTGSSAECPADAKSTAQCRDSFGDCDVPESCDGINDDCPADGFKTSAFQCRTAAGVCDAAESCSGSSATCPADAKSTAQCRDSAGDCDLPESCDGTNDDCPADVFKTNAVVCRTATGDCDVTENCSGSGALCPADAVRPDTFQCRGSDGSPCDPAEFCDGVGKNCGPDVCAGGTRPDLPKNICESN